LRFHVNSNFIFFFICGLFPGAAFAFCALKFKEMNIPDAHAGAILTAADCGGGAVAGIAAALLLLPFSGTYGVFTAVLAIACYVVFASFLFPLFNGRKSIAKGLLLILLGAGAFIFFIIATANNGKTEAVEKRIRTISLDNL